MAMTVSAPVARALGQRVSRAPSAESIRRRHVGELLARLDRNPLFDGEQAIVESLAHEPDTSLARILLESGAARLPRKPLERAKTIADMLLVEGWGSSDDAELWQEMLDHGVERLLERVQSDEPDKLKALNKARQEMYAPFCAKLAQLVFSDHAAGVQTVRSLIAGVPAVKRAPLNPDKLTAALLARALETLELNGLFPRTPQELVLSKAGGMLLAGAAPEFEDTLFNWIMPNVRVPAGARKADLTKLWEHMITARVALRKRPVD